MAGGNVVKNRATTITLGQTNTYTGSTTINAGILQISGDQNIGTAPASPTPGNINMAGGAQLTVTQDATIAANRGINFTGTSPSLISASTGKTITYNGIAAGTGGLTFNPGSDGTLILGGNSTYAGATNVNGTNATIKIATNNALPTGTALGLNGTNSKFDLNGFNQQVGRIVTNGGTPTITNSAASTNTLTVNGPGAGTAAFPIVSGGAAGNLNLVKSGTGALTLASNTNNYGTTTVTGGALIVANTSAIPDPTTFTPTAGVYLNPGGITFTGGAFGARIGSDGVANTDLDAIVASTVLFNATPGKAVAIEVTTTGASATYSTAIDDLGGVSRGVQKWGGGTLILSATNNYSGDTTFGGGTLQADGLANLGTSNNFVFDGGALLTNTNFGTIARNATLLSGGGTINLGTDIARVTTYSGNISGTGGFTKSGFGELILTGTNTYSGATTLTGAAGSASPSILTVSSLGNSSALAFTGGTSLSGANSGGGTLKTAASLGNFSGPISLGDFAIATIDTNGFDSTFSGAINGFGTFTKAGLGTLTLSGNNSAFYGRVNLNGGGLRVTNSNALGSQNQIMFIQGGTTLDTVLQLDGGAAPGGGITIAKRITFEGKSAGQPNPSIQNISGNNTISNALTMDAAATWYNLQSDAGKLTINGVNNATGNATGRILQLRGAGDGEVNGTIQNTAGSTGVVSVNKFDSGTWTLSAANSYTGTTTVNAGRLQATKANALPGYNAAGKVTVNSGATLGINAGGTLEWTDAPASPSNAAFEASTLYSNATFAAGSNFAINTDHGNFTLTASMGQANALTKEGANTLTLTGASTYTGGTSVNAGTLALGNADATAGGSINVANGALAQAQAGLPKAVTVSTLNTNTSGKFDVTNNSMVVRSMADTQVRSLLASGYNAGGWNGPTGITSSSAAASTETSVGYASNASLGLTTFKGVDGLTASDVLVKYTYAGDANLDGKVDIADLGLLAGAWQQSGKVWFDGDFTYNGTVDIGDLGLIAGNWQKGVGSGTLSMDFTTAMAQFAAFDGVVVPEPASLSLLAFGAAGLLGRRRRVRPH